MISDKDLEDIVLALAHHQHSINVISEALAHHTVALMNLCIPCSSCCTAPATVQHFRTDVVLCDRCCAETVCENHAEDVCDMLWHDLPTAQAVRYIDAHNTIINEFKGYATTH